MRNLSLILTCFLALLIASCSSVYKKHYDNGFTFIKHKKKTNVEVATKKQDLQQNSVAIINQNAQNDKLLEQKKADKSFQTYHKNIDKINNNAPGRLLSSINKFSLNKIQSLKPDTLYRKEPAKSNPMNDATKNKAQAALVFGIVSIVAFWFLWILSLIPAIIALSMAKKANAMAKLNGEPPPSDANTAKILAWVTIGLNLLSLLIILLYIMLIILFMGI